jgi:hypothetical protein
MVLGLYGHGRRAGCRRHRPRVVRRLLLSSLPQHPPTNTTHSYVFGRFRSDLHFEADKVSSEGRTIPTYLAVFMFGYLYQLFLVWDALRMKNTIQVIGIVIYNVGILVYAGIQYDQIRDAADILLSKAFIPADFWQNVQPMLIAVPAFMALATVVFAFIAWKLYDEFAWTIYKHISADLRLKRRYLTYQVRSHCNHLV